MFVSVFMLYIYRHECGLCGRLSPGHPERDKVNLECHKKDWHVYRNQADMMWACPDCSEAAIALGFKLPPGVQVPSRAG